MKKEQLIQNNKLIGTKHIGPGKQRKVSALFGALCLCFKTVPNKAPSKSCFAGTVCLVPKNDCVGQVVQSQNSTSISKKITSMMGAPCNTLFMRCLEYLAN